MPETVHFDVWVHEETGMFFMPDDKMGRGHVGSALAWMHDTEGGRQVKLLFARRTLTVSAADLFDFRISSALFRGKAGVEIRMHVARELLQQERKGPVYYVPWDGWAPGWGPAEPQVV